MKRTFSSFGSSGCFTCATCGRKTRDTGVQSLGSDLCPQCWDLAGHDNLVNDTGGAEGLDEASMKWANGLLAEIAKRGGDVQKARDSNPYIWPAAPAVKAPTSLWGVAIGGAS